MSRPQGQRLVFCLLELLSRRLEGELRPQSGASCTYNTWATDSEEPFVQTVTTVWRGTFSLDTPKQYQEASQQLQSIKYPPATSNTPSKQLLLHVCHDLSLAVLAQLMETWDTEVEALLRAVLRCHDSGNFYLAQKVCATVLPDGCSRLHLAPTTPALRSLEAFITYGHLYEFWWALSSTRNMSASGKQKPEVETDEQKQEVETDSRPRTCAEPEPEAPLRELAQESVQELESQAPTQEPEPQASPQHSELREPPQDTEPLAPPLEPVPQAAPRGSEGMGQVLSASLDLLSEPYAQLQEAQRTVTDVQETLAHLIRQHQKSQLCLEQDTGPAPGSKEEREPVSLPELTRRLTEANEKIAKFPESVKAWPFPDVLECCLVVLRICTLSPMCLAQETQQRARELLHKYGSCRAYRHHSQPC